LQIIKPELITNEICKLDIKKCKKDGIDLAYIHNYIEKIDL
jgi:hypothetical protein